MKKIFFSLAIFFHITNISYSQTTPEQILSKGLEAFFGAEFQDGIKYFNEYIEISPNDYKGYNYRGLCYMSLKDYQRALEDFTKAISIAPNNNEVFNNRGNTYLLSENVSSAIEDFTDAIKYNPNDVEGYIGRSRAYTAQGKYPNAISDLNLASGADPKNARVYINMAWVHILNNDTVKVFENLNTALDYDSNIVFTNFKRDQIYVKVENYKQAREAADHEINSNPAGYMGYFTRGVINYLLNDYTNATEDLKKSLRLNDKNDPGFLVLVDKLLRSIKRNS